MHRSGIFYLTLSLLLAACAPTAANASGVLPGPMVGLTAFSQLESPLTTAVPQLVATATPSCRLAKAGIKIMLLGDSITYGELRLSVLR
jgi:hypothetical protein